MKRLFLILLFASPALAQFQMALPGYHYQFPRDFFNHPKFQTEWWYYTGNLRAKNGREFGFELTFFRFGISPRKSQESPWSVNTIYMAHLALSDLTGRQFVYRERFNRAGPGFAGVDSGKRLVWNGNWKVQWQGNAQDLQAVADTFTLNLRMTSLKPPVINGRDGVSQKGPGRGEASHYISLTRLDTRGAVTWKGKTYEVSGSAWMDHEFFTQQLENSISGWDWLCLQLDNNTELMLYRLRLKQGGISPYSSGTYVDAKGRSRFLSFRDFTLIPGATWTSPRTHARYPIEWRIEAPLLHLKAQVSTPLDSQELVSQNAIAPSYWEGAIHVAGEDGGTPVRGVGYLEMTGYAHPISSGY